MAWTAPATYSVGQVVAAVDLNLIRDNLNYLKGNAGPVALADALSIAVNVNTAGGLTVVNSNAGSSALSGVVLNNDGGNVAGLYRNSSTNTAYGGANSLNLLTTGAHPFGFSTSNALRMLIDASGNVGIGTASPLSKLHVAGASGSNAVMLAATGVGATPVVLLPTSSFSKFLIPFGGWKDDVNSLTNVFSAQTLPPGSTLPFGVGGNTAQLTTTSGGLSVNRTAGTGTYSLVLWALFI